MKEKYSWDDSGDGNIGYYFEELTPKELQAAYELGEMEYTPYGWPDYRVKMRIHLNHEGQPRIGLIPNKGEAEAIRTAIETRAAEIKRPKPPTMEQIREGIFARGNARKVK